VGGRKLWGTFAQEWELRGTPPPRPLSVCPIMAEAAEITDLPRLHSNPSRTATVRSGATERAEAQRPQIYAISGLWMPIGAQERIGRSRVANPAISTACGSFWPAFVPPNWTSVKAARLGHDRWRYAAHWGCRAGHHSASGAREPPAADTKWKVGNLPAPSPRDAPKWAPMRGPNSTRKVRAKVPGWGR
jgi:hypothetical protein